MTKQVLIPDFVKLFSEVNSIILLSGDSFLIETVGEQLQSLLMQFVRFLQVKDNNHQGLTFQLSNIVTTLAIFSHLNRIPHLQFLSIERNVLVFRKSLFAFHEVTDKERRIVIHKSESISPRLTRLVREKDNSILNSTQKKILGFIEGGNEVLNIEVFNHFKDMSKRTLKRHLSQLISGGYINREAQGKKVYYSKPPLSIHKMGEDAQS